MPQGPSSPNGHCPNSICPVLWGARPLQKMGGGGQGQGYVPQEAVSVLVKVGRL